MLFSHFHKLQELKLERNSLEMLPESFGNLENLKSLAIYGNKLKNLPKSFGNLKKLENLELSSFLGNNQIEDLVNLIDIILKLDLNKQEKRKEAILRHNFSDFSKIPDYYLHLDDNNIKELPLSIVKLTCLKGIHLKNNALNNLPNSFKELKWLRELDLEYNKFELFPLELIELPRINKLNLAEKLLLVEDLWDSIAQSNSELPLPEWQKAELDKRYKEYQSGNLTLHEWRSVHEEIRKEYFEQKNKKK